MKGQQAPTCVARLMPAVPSAIATVVVQGPAATQAVTHYFHPRGNKPLVDAPVQAIMVGHWGSATGEQLVICRRSVEGYEIHCHGGTAAVDAVVASLVRTGCREVSWQQWISRSEPDPTRRDALVALSGATTLRAATILMDQYHGALRDKTAAIVQDIRCGRYRSALDQLADLFDRSQVGLHLVRPWRVVLAGPPNVGKSSLMNRLLGFPRAIVDDEPGTTRDVVGGRTALEGWPVELADTAGLRIGEQAASQVETEGMQRTRSVSASADLVLHVVDAAHAGRDSHGADLDVPSIRCLRVYSKCDLLATRRPGDRGFFTSAKTGEGIAALTAAIAQHLVPSPPPPGAAVPFTDEQRRVLRMACQAVRDRQPDRALARLAMLLGPADI